VPSGGSHIVAAELSRSSTKFSKKPFAGSPTNRLERKIPPMLNATLAGVISLALVSTSSYQNGSNLIDAVRIAAIEQAQGRRAELEKNSPAPFAGVLLDDVALGLLRSEVASLRGELEDVRAALSAQKMATDEATFRGDLWRAESRNTALDRLVRYGCAVSFGITSGLIISR
jgi:hypothetical protein